MDHMDKIFFVSLHPLSNIDNAKYFNYGQRFNGVFSREHSTRIKTGAYVINFGNKQSKETHWVLFIGRNTAVYFDILEFNMLLKKYLTK